MSALTVRWMSYPSDDEFAVAAPLLARVVAEASKGEFTVDDLRRMAQKGRVLIGVAERGAEVVMAAAIELVRYPQFSTVNVMALGGEGLREIAGRFFDDLKKFARSTGAKHIEADCSPAMARLLKGIEFKQAYEKVRLAL